MAVLLWYVVSFVSSPHVMSHVHQVTFQFWCLQVHSGLPRNLTAAIQRYASSNNSKATAVTMLDHHGKTVNTLTYAKLYSKMLKVAYNLLNKIGTKTDPVLRPGDKVSIYVRYAQHVT